MLFAATIGASADDAAQLIADAAAKLRNAKSVTAVCKITSAAGIENATLTMSGNKFRVKSAKADILYDGTTMWAYSAATNEVSISEPTPEEISQINPLAVMDYYTKSYTASALPSSGGQKNIKLTADARNAAISSAEVSLKATTLTPTAVNLLLSSGQKISIAVSSVKFGGALPSSTFTYRLSLHPSAQLVDLR